MARTFNLAVIMSVCILLAPLARADVYINVMAVNGTAEPKQTPVRFDLPGDLKADDILDTSGLKLDYDASNGNYVVSGDVSLEAKESKTFRIRVKDIWKMSEEEIAKVKAEIEKGFEQVGKLRDTQKAEILKQQLTQKLDYITQEKGVRAETVEKRIDAFRAYSKELQRIKDQALAVDFWRSEPGSDEEKIIRLKVEVANAKTNTVKMVKQKVYLPAEVKPQHVVDAQGFEVRFDDRKRQAFLFKEEEMEPGQKKTYEIGIQDVWFIPQRDIDYLRGRADYAYDFLRNSKFGQASKFLYEQAGLLLADIETSQAQTLDINGHISAFRVNHKTLENARMNVENLEKLLSVLREDLEKSRIENVLQKVRSLKGLANVAKTMFDKKPTPSTAWTFIGWILLFVGFLTFLNFVVWMLRSRDKGKTAEPVTPAEPAKPKAAAEKK